MQHEKIGIMWTKNDFFWTSKFHNFSSKQTLPMKRLLATCAANNGNYNKIDKTSLAYTEGEIS